MARLLGIRIRNYKSLADVKLGQVQYAKGDPLPRLACFIGANGSGKSTLLDAFGFISDALLEGVEAACDKPWRGGFEKIRTQGETGPIAFELFFQHDDPERPIVYELHVNESKGVPSVSVETLRQRRVGETRGKPYYFLKLTSGRGKVWAGEAVGGDLDTRGSEAVNLDNTNRLGLTTLGNLAEHPRIVALRRYVEQWYLSYFVPDAARELPASGAQRYLDRRGGNIGNVLQYFQRNYESQFQGIVARVTDAIPGLRRIDVDVSADRRLLLRFDEGGYADPFFQQSMSDGTLKMLAYAVLLADPEPRPFIGIEEPENGLYLTLIEHLARHFREHAESTQILVTTHSPYFVDALRANEVWQLKKDHKGQTTAIRVSDIKHVKELVAEGIPLGAQWYSNHFDTDELEVQSSDSHRSKKAGKKKAGKKKAGKKKAGKKTAGKKTAGKKKAGKKTAGKKTAGKKTAGKKKAGKKTAGKKTAGKKAGKIL